MPNMPNTPNMPDVDNTTLYRTLCSNQNNEIPDLPPLICGNCDMYHSFGGTEYIVPDICEMCICDVD